MLRTLQAAEIAGIRAMAVHDERFDFTPSPSDPYNLFLLLKDIRALLSSR